MGESKLTKNQHMVFLKYHGTRTILATVRWDDKCGNGHNTFSITGEVYGPDGDKFGKKLAPGQWLESCGCIHEDIAAAFPELAPLIKWHLCSSDGPMHYGANVAYLAGDRDHDGKRKGEPWRWSLAVRFKGFPILWRERSNRDFLSWLARKDKEPGPRGDYEAIRIDHDHKPGDHKYGSKWTLRGAPDKWHECPFDSEEEAIEFLAAMQLGWSTERIPCAWSEGKARELDVARQAAVWPDATDEDLMAPGLAERLATRLPALLAEFRAAVESLGFTW